MNVRPTFSPPLLARIFQGTVTSRLDFAREVFATSREALTSDPDIAQALAEMQTLASTLDRQMLTMAMDSLCSRCAASPGGGCCSLEMAGETDAIQMLMNMLTGVTVTMVRNDGQECCFLGRQGCIFTFKPMFCLNYNCRRIVLAAKDGQLQDLERITGSLLGTQYRTEQLIIRRLGKQTVPGLFI